MGFVAGWVGCSLGAIELSTKMTEYAPKQYRNKVKTLTTSFSVCSATENHITELGQCIFIGYGGGLNERDGLTKIAKDYLEKGNQFINNVKGDFSLIIIDTENKKLLLAIDPLGHRNLYFAETPNGLAFSSTADAVIAQPEVNNNISLQSIYDYVYFHHCPSPNTIYESVKKLEGGQQLVFQAGKVNLDRYWAPAFSETMDFSLSDVSKELQDCLFRSVKRLSGSAEQTGAFLSGGLDSSSVAGALAKVYPNQANTFSMGFPVEGYDEISFARIASENFKTIQHEYYVTAEDTVAAIPSIAAYYDEPFGNSSALAAFYCAKLAKDNGIEVLLAGDGGDELFAGNERYARQLLFEKYFSVPAPFRQLLKSFLTKAPGVVSNNNLIFKAKRYIEQAETPLPDRLQDYNFLHRHQAEDIFQADFLSHIVASQPLESLRDSYRRPENATSLNRRLYMDWKTTLHDNDLVKVNKMCEMAGVEVHYPLLDHEMLELSLRIPSSIKLKGQNLRWFYKHAMNGFLPNEILNKSKHGFGLPFGIWLKDYQPLKELAYDSINSLKKRPYFAPDFLDYSIKMHQSIHAAYYGELIWVLMMLELWMQAKNI